MNNVSGRHGYLPVAVFALLFWCASGHALDCESGKLNFPATDRFLNFMEKSAAEFLNKGILVHVQTLAYEDGEDCRFAYRLKWLGDDGLVSEGYYDDLLFHRVMNEFMIQGGDPQSKAAPAGAPLGNSGPGYTVPANFQQALYHKKGALAAARQPDQVSWCKGTHWTKTPSSLSAARTASKCSRESSAPAPSAEGWNRSPTTRS